MKNLMSKKEEALKLNAEIIKKRNSNKNAVSSIEKELEIFSKSTESMVPESDISKFERNESDETLIGDLMDMLGGLKSTLSSLQADYIENEKISVGNLQTLMEQLSTMGPQTSSLESTLSELQSVSHQRDEASKTENHSSILHGRTRLLRHLNSL